MARSNYKRHGMKGTSIYDVWTNMKRRCYDKSITRYKYYGGRGIQVCERWHNFSEFYTDMGDKPKDRFIDRIDNDGNYEPGNCRWSTAEEQQNNRRNNVVIEHNGKSMTLAQWAAHLGMQYDTLWMRIKKYNWSVSRAISTPTRPQKSRATLQE